VGAALTEHVHFIDCHSHVVPSGDDGVQTVEEGLKYCQEAYRRGTTVLFATPHVAPAGAYPMYPEREAEFRENLASMRKQATLDLRVGFEVAPASSLLNEDPHRYALEGTNLLLIETARSKPLDELVMLGEHAEAAGLRPLIAHPEYSWAILRNPSLADGLAERGWLLQVSAESVCGLVDQVTERVAWSLLLRGVATVVASDGHGPRRPPYLDVVYRIVCERLSDHADPLFNGRNLGVVATRDQPVRS